MIGKGIGISFRKKSSGGETLLPPSNTVAPAISGGPFVGDDLTVSDGTWDNEGTFTYQWYRNGVAIGGETSNTYTLLLGDEGDTIRCDVTSTNGAGFNTASSNNYLIKTGSASRPDSVSFVSATTSSVTITFDENGPGAVAWQVYNSQNFQLETALTNTYTIEGLPSGATFNVGVKGIDFTGNLGPQFRFINNVSTL
jgi:hypothetical protein